MSIRRSTQIVCDGCGKNGLARYVKGKGRMLEPAKTIRRTLRAGGWLVAVSSRTHDGTRDYCPLCKGLLP